MNYPINYPFADFFQRLGFTLIVRVDVIFDDEAKVYVATSRDIKGLVLEAETFDELQSEVQEATVNLMELNKRKKVRRTNTDLIYHGHFATV